MMTPYGKPFHSFNLEYSSDGRSRGYKEFQSECTGDSLILLGQPHRLPGTESLLAGAGDAAFSVCEIHSGENIPDIPEEILLIREPAASDGFSRCKSGCKGVKTSVNEQTIVLVA